MEGTIPARSGWCSRSEESLFIESADEQPLQDKKPRGNAEEKKNSADESVNKHLHSRRDAYPTHQVVLPSITSFTPLPPLPHATESPPHPAATS